jgi:hypothetical protein
MADVVNLRAARKRKKRSESEQQAAENRARFGRARDARVAERLSAELETRRHDAHRIAARVPDSAEEDGDGSA